MIVGQVQLSLSHCFHLSRCIAKCDRIRAWKHWARGWPIPCDHDQLYENNSRPEWKRIRWKSWSALLYSTRSVSGTSTCPTECWWRSPRSYVRSSQKNRVCSSPSWTTFTWRPEVARFWDSSRFWTPLVAERCSPTWSIQWVSDGRDTLLMECLFA